MNLKNIIKFGLDDFNYQGQNIFESKDPEFFLLKNGSNVSKDGKQITKDIVDLIFSTDPTRNKAYVNWLALLWKRMESKIFKEDAEKIKKYLETFDKIKHKLAIRDRNIFNFDSVMELEKIVRPYYEKPEDALSKRQLKGDTLVEGEYDILNDDNNWLVVIPNTYRASCYWGSGTEWCTAYDNDDSYYKSYSEDGHLYIIINKKNPIEKYQLHINSGSFMDRWDHSVDITKIIENADFKKVLENIFSVEFHNFNHDKEEVEKLFISYVKDDKPESLYFLLRMQNTDSNLLNIRSEEFRENIYKNSEGKPTAIHYACFHGYEDIIKILAYNGAKLNEPSNEGNSYFSETPVLIACRLDDVNILHLLIENGADPSGLSSKYHRYEDQPSLETCAIYCSTTCAKYLIENGHVDPDLQNSSGEKAYDHARCGQMKTLLYNYTDMGYKEVEETEDDDQ